MRDWTLFPLVCLGLFVAMAAEAWQPVAVMVIAPGVADAGGGRSSSPDGVYQVDATLGGVYGSPLPGETAGDSANRAGYVAQLFEFQALVLEGVPMQTEEESFVDLFAVAHLDDGTRLEAAGASASSGTGWFRWSAAAGGRISEIDITQAGRLTVGAVFDTVLVEVGVAAGHLHASTVIEVRDTLGDNWPGYAADGLRDAWQVANFGENNPAAAPLAEPYGDGVANLLKHAWNIAASDRTYRPAHTLEGDRLTISYRRLRAGQSPRPGYRVEVSSDLLQWNSNADPGGPRTEEVSVTPLDPQTELVVAQDLLPASPANPRFIRLNITEP